MDNVVPILGQSKMVPNEVVDLLGAALAHAFEFLSAVDASNAHANLSEQIKPRPLTMLVGDALKRLGEVAA